MTYDDFIARYPEFGSIPESQFDNYVVEAKMILARYCINETVYDIILMKAIAHLMQLSINRSVGRVSSGTQGSTNVSLEYEGTKGGSYWNQTPYGAYIYEFVVKPAFLGGRYAI